MAVLVIWLVDDKSPLLGQVYDGTSAWQLQSGELEQKGNEFSWLGLLRVQLRDSMTVGLSGLVLVKEKYAIAHAMDVAKIPQKIFRDDSAAMFFHGGKTWYAGLVDYLTHPEYDSARNTIALVELDLRSNGTDTDELDKVIYKLQHVSAKQCNALYVETGLETSASQPLHSRCMVATDASKECQWENGMAMASNSTGQWTLIGLAIRGPKCSLPARFIDVFPYLDWVRAATEHRGSKYNSRKSGFNIGFQIPEETPADELEYVPLHQTGTAIQRAREIFYIRLHFARHRDAGKFFKVDRVDEDAINISVFDEIYEQTKGSCTTWKILVYRDRTRVVAMDHIGTAAFRLTLYDMLLGEYTCIKVRVKSSSREKAKLWWVNYVDLLEGAFFKNYSDTARELLKINPIRPRTLPTTAAPGMKKRTPGPHLEPQFIKEHRNVTNERNINLLIKFRFRKEAILHVYVYGKPSLRPTTARTTTQKAGWWIFGRR